MKIEDFIIRVENIKPSKEIYFKMKNRAMPQKFEDEYIIEQRESIKIRDNKDDDIIYELVNKFKAERIKFGDYCFLNFMEKKRDFNIFCYSSNSFLAYQSPHTEIIEYDNDSTQLSVLEYCAKDSSAFLEALLHLLELYSLRLQGSVNSNDNEINKLFVDKCTISAGGQKYARFYKNIIF